MKYLIILIILLFPVIMFGQDSISIADDTMFGWVSVTDDTMFGRVSVTEAELQDSLTVSAVAICPNCGSSKIYQDGEDEFYLTCYGIWYWERAYYSPAMLMPVKICDNCGTVYLWRSK